MIVCELKKKKKKPLTHKCTIRPIQVHGEHYDIVLNKRSLAVWNFNNNTGAAPHPVVNTPDAFGAESDRYIIIYCIRRVSALFVYHNTIYHIIYTVSGVCFLSFFFFHKFRPVTQSLHKYTAVYYFIPNPHWNEWGRLTISPRHCVTGIIIPSRR